MASETGDGTLTVTVTVPDLITSTLRLPDGAETTVTGGPHTLTSTRP